MVQKEHENILISIITPVYNQVDLIGQAIESVIHQEDAPVEHIVMDGGSTDGTLDVLAQYSHLKVVSGTDQGMYDALNKGIEIAKGNVIGFLNSDDLYVENTFSEILQIFKDEHILAVVGNAIVFSETSDKTRNILSRFSSENIKSLLELSTSSGPFLNAWFFRKSLFARLGNFNSNYRIVADRDLMLRLALNGVEYTKFNKVVYMYRQHFGSMTFDPTEEKIERIVHEHIFMTNLFLEQDGIPKQARKLIRDIRTRNTLEMAIRSLKKLNLQKFSFFFLRGTEYDVFWFFKFIYRIARAVVSRVKKSVSPSEFFSLKNP
jgi:glycosyltransferase involved in cell wall biosynthesis